MNDMAKNLILWIIIAIVLMSVFNNFGARQTSTPQMAYSQFIGEVKQGQVKSVHIDNENNVITGTFHNDEKFTTYSPNDPGLIGDLLDNGVEVLATPPEQESLLMTGSPCCC